MKNLHRLAIGVRSFCAAKFLTLGVLSIFYITLATKHFFPKSSILSTFIIFRISVRAHLKARMLNFQIPDFFSSKSIMAATKSIMATNMKIIAKSIQYVGLYAKYGVKPGQNDN